LCSAIGMMGEARRGMPSVVTQDLAAPVAMTLDREELRERMSGNLCRCGAYNGIVDAIVETFDIGIPEGAASGSATRREPA